MMTVENILDDARHDVWAVNVEEDYHEAGAADACTTLKHGLGEPLAGSAGADAPVDAAAVDAAAAKASLRTA